MKTNGLVLWVLTAASVSISAHQAPAQRSQRSLFGRKFKQADHMRVQAARLNRLEDRIEKMSMESALLVERARQHREMRLKCSADLREKVEELKLKFQSERERMQKDFEERLAAVREELLAQAMKDREALEAELGLRHEGERERLLEEARERADEMVKEVKAEMAAEAERDRELYAQRAALAEEGQELAREDRKQLQAEKDKLVQQLEETTTVEDATRRKIILKFKARENTLRRNFEAQLREARAAASGSAVPPGSASTRPRSTKAAYSSTNNSNAREGSHRAAVKSPNGAALPNASTSGGVAPTPQR